MDEGKVKIGSFPAGTSKNDVLLYNGMALDKWCTKCVTTENLNGSYDLDTTFTADASPYINQFDILKVLIEDDHEIFEISKEDSELRYPGRVARQITIPETLGLYLDDVRPENVSGAAALSYLYSKAEGTKNLTVYSNITNSSTAYYPDKNLYEALHDCDQSFQNRWGGEVQRRKYKLSILAHVGEDKGVAIREAKNLSGFRMSSNVDGIYTKVRGKTADGITGDWQDSPIINNYPRIYRHTFEYKVKLREADSNAQEDDEYAYFDTEAEVKAELNRLASLEFSENEVDKLHADISIDWVALEKTEQYKDYVQAERVEIGDTVHVYVPSLGVTVTARAYEKQYDVLAHRPLTLSLSTDKVETVHSMGSILNTLEKQLKTTGSVNVGEYIKAILGAGLQNSNVMVRHNELLIMDTKDIYTARNVWRWNAGALAHSNTGYFSSDWNIGLTQDGVIYADMIKAGILTAILIQSEDGSCSIDLASGTVNFSKGKILGRNSSWNLDTGVFETNGVLSDGTKRQVRLYDGGITSNECLWLQGVEAAAVQIKAPDGRYYGLNVGIGHDATSGSVTDNGVTILSGDQLVVIKCNSGGKISLSGDVAVTGTLTVNGQTVSGGSQGGGTSGGSALQNAVVTSARKLIGKPYVYGGNYPPLGNDSGTDCSGLMKWSYNDNGITISRTTYTQINEGMEVASADDLQPGDLVFPYANTSDNHHVFMFSKRENGNLYCVEAYSTGYPIRETTFTWNSNYRARRIITS